MSSIAILEGDCLDVLRTLPAGTFQTCVTSPPYYGLRDYGVAGQIGLEPTPDEYVTRMVAVFAEVRRVLRDDGTLWLNVGDSYAATTKGSGGHNPKQDSNGGSWMADRRWQIPDGTKPKDLLGIPWMLAFALRADGWFLRADIIWSKPNPMPESVRDRPTKAHEYVFLLTKRARYFYDAEAIKEDAEYGPSIPRDGAKDGPFAKKECGSMGGFRGGSRANGVGGHRNARSVWTIATAPCSLAHFATMPPDLAERCIKASTSERGQCPHCGSPWARVVVDTGEIDGTHKGSRFDSGKTVGRDGGDRAQPGARTLKAATGWTPTCECDQHPPMPQHVLDPFGGAGTTGLVADRLQRHATLIELNPEYAAMARERLRSDAPLLVDVA